MNEPDDRTLVRAFLDGDPSAFEVLVDRYQRPVFNVAFRISNDREDARDVAQTTFVKACEKLKTFDPQFKFFNWLYRIAINEALNVVDRRRPQSELDDDLVAPGDTPEEQFDREQVCRGVRAGVMQLSRAHRDIIILRHFANLSYAQIGEVLEIPEKTVKSRLFSARSSLRQALNRGRVEKA